MLPLFATAYVTVLIAELVGDKTLYTLGTLGAKYRALPIMLGASAPCTERGDVGMKRTQATRQRLRGTQ